MRRWFLRTSSGYTFIELVVATAETSSTVHFLDAATGKALSTALVGSRPRDVLFVPPRGF